MNRLIKWAKRPPATSAGLPNWLFELAPLSASPEQRLRQHREIRALVRRAYAARIVY
ncbi:MAG: hypothetical protein WBN68_10670 [Sedimenticolaceae bacterium]